MAHLDWPSLLDRHLPTLAAFLAFVTSLINSRRIKKVHVDVNSRMTQLLEEKGRASRAEGRREGVESNKNL